MRQQLLIVGLAILLGVCSARNSSLKSRLSKVKKVGNKGEEVRKHKSISRLMKRAQKNKVIEIGAGYKDNFGQYSNLDAGKQDFEGSVQSAQAVIQTGQELFKGRGETQTSMEFMTQKTVQVFTLAKEGMLFMYQGLSLVNNILGTGKLDAFLHSLGPIAICISLGLSVLSMGQRMIEGKPLFEKTDHEKQMEAIEQIANKVEDLDSKMEYLFEKNSKQSQLLASKAMNQRNEEKMYYAVIQHDKVTKVCTDRKEIPDAEVQNLSKTKSMSEQQIARLQAIDLMRKKCELEENRYKQEMDNIEFGFEFEQFMSLYSGDNGDLGINFWKAMLEASANDFKEYDKVFASITDLATKASVAFIHYKLASHKASVREAFIQAQQDKLFRQKVGMAQKEMYDDEYFYQNYKYLAESIDCESCVELEPRYKQVFLDAEQNYLTVVGKNTEHIEKIQNALDRKEKLLNSFRNDLKPQVERAMKEGSNKQVQAEQILQTVQTAMNQDRFKKYSMQVVIADKRNEKQVLFNRDLGKQNIQSRQTFGYAYHDEVLPEDKNDPTRMKGDFDSVLYQQVDKNVPYMMKFSFETPALITRIKMIHNDVRFDQQQVGQDLKDSAARVLRFFQEESFFSINNPSSVQKIECNHFIQTFLKYVNQPQEMYYDMACQRLDDAPKRDDTVNQGSSAFSANNDNKTPMKSSNPDPKNPFIVYVKQQFFSHQIYQKRTPKEETLFQKEQQGFLKNYNSIHVVGNKDLFYVSDQFQGEQGMDNFYSLTVTIPKVDDKKKIPLETEKNNHRFRLTFTRSSLPVDINGKIKKGVTFNGKQIEDFDK